MTTRKRRLVLIDSDDKAKLTSDELFKRSQSSGPMTTGPVFDQSNEGDRQILDLFDRDDDKPMRGSDEEDVNIQVEKEKDEMFFNHAGLSEVNGSGKNDNSIILPADINRSPLNNRSSSIKKKQPLFVLPPMMQPLSAPPKRFSTNFAAALALASPSDLRIKETSPSNRRKALAKTSARQKSPNLILSSQDLPKRPEVEIIGKNSNSLKNLPNLTPRKLSFNTRFKSNWSQVNPNSPTPAQVLAIITPQEDLEVETVEPVVESAAEHIVIQESIIDISPAKSRRRAAGSCKTANVVTFQTENLRSPLLKRSRGRPRNDTYQNSVAKSKKTPAKASVPLKEKESEKDKGKDKDREKDKEKEKEKEIVRHEHSKFASLANKQEISFSLKDAAVIALSQVYGVSTEEVSELFEMHAYRVDPVRRTLLKKALIRIIDHN